MNVFFFALVGITTVAADAATIYGAQPFGDRSDVIYQRAHVFNVTDFGAIGDGKTMNTKAINEAVAAVAKAGDGTIYFPAGRWLTAPFNVTSHCTLFFAADAVLLGSTNFDDWPIIPALPSYGQGRDHPGPRRTSLIHGQNLTDVIITGQNGTIDGQGAVWWANHKSGKEKYTRGHLIELMWSTDVEVSYLYLTGSPFWTVHPVYVRGFVARYLTIIHPEDSPNTDGIDPDSTQDVLIEYCTIRTGDDSIAIKSGWDIYGYTYGIPSKNITIRNCEFSSPCCAALCIGSEMSGNVEDVYAHDLYLHSSSEGLRIKTGMGRGGVVSNINLANARLDNMKYTFQYNEFYGGHPAGANLSAIPTVVGLHVTNVTGDGADQFADLEGLKVRPLTNITFDHVHVTNTKKQWVCSEVVDSYARDTTPTPCQELQP
eukprot:m.69288 g.69288  ORF g.69288 m.69288 type:complete len:429 (-) comp19970_c0_seq4:190-1476(-)